MESYGPGRRRRRGMPRAKDAAQAPDLFNAPARPSATEPRARSTDRRTSQHAAGVAARGDLSATQRAVLQVIREHVTLRGVGITDDQLVIEYRTAPGSGHAKRSPQRIRTARADLVRLGWVRDSGQIAPSELGNPATVWEPAPRV